MLNIYLMTPFSLGKPFLFIFMVLIFFFFLIMTFLLERNAILHYIDHHSHVLLTSSDQVLICHGCTPKHENSKNIYIYLAGLCVFIIIMF
jgi:hypothetical protein